MAQPNGVDMYLQKKRKEHIVVFSKIQPPSWLELRLSAVYGPLACLFWQGEDTQVGGRRERETQRIYMVYAPLPFNQLRTTVLVLGLTSNLS